MKGDLYGNSVDQAIDRRVENVVSHASLKVKGTNERTVVEVPKYRNRAACLKSPVNKKTAILALEQLLTDLKEMPSEAQVKYDCMIEEV